MGGYFSIMKPLMMSDLLKLETSEQAYNNIQTKFVDRIDYIISLIFRE